MARTDRGARGACVMPANRSWNYDSGEVNASRTPRRVGTTLEPPTTDFP
jgi:hypothetical protein